MMTTYVTGAEGMLGRAVWQELMRNREMSFIEGRSHKQLDISVWSHVHELGLR